MAIPTFGRYTRLVEMASKMTLLGVHNLIDDARRPENSQSISDVILQLEMVVDRVSRSYTDDDDPVEAYRAIWSCGLSETLTRDGDAATYSRCLRERDEYGYLHIDEKTTYYCILAELFRGEGQFGKALAILQRIREELTAAKRDEFVEKGLYDVDRLISLNQKQ